jgi:acetyl/propionyl-CoA carboxylase alpha subunit
MTGPYIDSAERTTHPATLYLSLRFPDLLDMLRPMSHTDSTGYGTYHVHVGAHSFQITVDADGVRVGGEPVACSFESLNSNYATMILDGRSVAIVWEHLEGDAVRITIEGQVYDARLMDKSALLRERLGMSVAEEATEREVRAPMPGLVLDVLVEAGMRVRAGDGLIVLEAMKMENELRAASDGIVRVVHVVAGEAVQKNAVLVEFRS